MERYNRLPKLEKSTKLYFTYDIDGYDIPCTMIRGNREGKRILISGQIHAGEYPATPAIIKLAKELRPEDVSGEIIFMPCVNTSGFWAGTNATVAEDGGNLNKVYPGDNTTASGKIAQAFINDIFKGVDFILDLHAGGIDEMLTPCLFFPVEPTVRKASLEVAKYIDIPYVLSSFSKVGEFSYASNVLGIPALLLERGCAGFCRKSDWLAYIEDMKDVLGRLGAIERSATLKKHLIYEKVYYEIFRRSGLWYPCDELKVDALLKGGTVLGHTEDFAGNLLDEYRMREDGRIFYYRYGLNGTKDHSVVAYGLESSCHDF